MAKITPVEFLVGRKFIYDKHRRLHSLFIVPDASEADSYAEWNESFDQLADGFPSYVFLERQWLSDTNRLGSMLFPGVGMVVAVEDEIGADEADTFEAIGTEGHPIVLKVNSPAILASLESLTDVIRMIEFDLDVVSLATVRESVAELAGRTSVLVSNVRNELQFRHCHSHGVEYFQGPGILRVDRTEGTVSTDRIAVMQLLVALNDPNVELSELEKIIETGPGLVLSLLRHINVAAFALRRRIGTVKQAVTLLGLDRVQRFATAMAIGRTAPRNRELAQLALVRAEMARTLATAVGMTEVDECFTAGLLSIAEVLVQTPMAEIVEELPLSDSVESALLFRDGRVGEVLECVLAYEECDWPIVRQSGVNADVVRHAYLNAVRSARTVIEGDRSGLAASRTWTGPAESDDREAS